MLLIWVKQDRATSVKSSLKLTHQGMAVSAYYVETWRPLPERTAKNVDGGCPQRAGLEVRFLLRINPVLLCEF